jgi:hypothetical protein
VRASGAAVTLGTLALPWLHPYFTESVYKVEPCNLKLDTRQPTNPETGRACRCAMLGELKPKGPKGPFKNTQGDFEVSPSNIFQFSSAQKVRNAI